MPPRSILVLRHAEKPDDRSDPDLTVAGKARADKLAPFLVQQFGKPDFLFAASITRHSARPYETILPLSRQTGIPIDTSFADNDYGALAQSLLQGGRFAGTAVIVCWHHGNIPSLVRELGAPAGTYPNPWDYLVFDLILRIVYPASAAPDVSSIQQPF